jgi:hypothetical protein
MRAVGSRVWAVAWRVCVGLVTLSVSAEVAAAQAPADSLFTTIGITRLETRGNGEIFGNPPYSLPAGEMPASNTVVVPPNDASDDVPLRMPDTSGNVPNLAAFRGQRLKLTDEEQKPYAKMHLFGTTTDGGPAGGTFTLHYSDGSTQSIEVQFRDWCADPQDTPANHIAIGRLTKRYTRTGQDGARCSIYHVPANAQAGKTLVSVSLPSSTTPGNPPIQSYLMALTLEEPAGGFVTPDLSTGLQDTNAPTTTATTRPTRPFGTDGWHDGAVTVTLTANDGAGSGVAATRYRVDGGAWQTYGGPVTIADAGVHELAYFSADAEGNAEAVRSLRVKVDMTPPVTSARLNGAAPRAEYVGAVRVALIRTDGEGSGAVATEYRIGEGGWTTYAGSFDLEGLGGHRIDFRSRDLVGNAENFRSVAFTIRAAPAVLPFAATSSRPEPYAALVPVAARRSTVEALRRGRLSVRVTCQSVERGTLRLAVSRAAARELGLTTRVLARRSVHCSDEGRATVTLKPSVRVRRALKRWLGTLRVTLTLRITGAAGDAEDTERLTLRGKAGNR